MEVIAIELAVESAKAITKVVMAREVPAEKRSLAWGSIEKLQEKFTFIHAFLNDMRSAKNGELVNLWLQKLEAVAYDADLLMDDYAYELLRRKHESKVEEKFRNYLTLSSTNPIVVRMQLSLQMNQIMLELNELNKSARELGLKPAELAEKTTLVSSGGGSTSGGADNGYVDSLYQARKHAAARGSRFIGRKQDEHKLLQMLLNPTAKQTDLYFLAIVGIGGLGKTTLARRLYEHEKVDAHFDKIKVWICMSKNFNIEKLLKEMVESLTLTKCELTNIGAIIQKLETLLKGKKFFLVLDDVRNEDKTFWHSLKEELRRIGGMSGSVILITTRNNGIAKKACDDFHKLEGLSDEDGWTLLKQQVFDEKIMNNSFDDVGRRIVKKCQGVPLAIKSIGGLLKLKQNKFEWESIEGSELWNLKSDDYSNYIMPSLLLSYNDINRLHIKQCFAYCAIFPKNSRMQKGQLVAMWVAQGLIHDESKINDDLLETIGEQYIKKLVNYSFLEKEEDGGYETMYKMHDLVHDLATYVSRKNLFVWKVGVKPSSDVDFRLQHLAFDLEKSEIELETHTEKKMMRKLRTISFWSGVPSWKILDCARYIRTLVMVGVGLREVSSVIGNLVHLRYLDLSENYLINALPDSFRKLYQLQTLRVLECFRLRELPKELGRLENLRHIWTTSYLVAPKGLRQLTSLQTLPHLELHSEEGWTIDEIGPLDQVKGDVYIRGLENVKNSEDARKGGLGRKKVLNLYLSWDSGRDGEAIDDEVVLDGLEPHPILETLRIRGFEGVRFPKWLMTMSVEPVSGYSTITQQLSHLKELSLQSCKKCHQLPSLGQLPNLTILKLDEFDEVECIMDEFYYYENNNNNVAGLTTTTAATTHDLFPNIKELRIERFGSLPPGLHHRQ